MIRFFRTIRQSLLNSGNTRTYTLYAIGEILLVMVGILLALQVNNWNTNRVERAKEYILVGTLYDELKRNFDYIDHRENWYADNNEASGKKLLQIISSKQVNLPTDSVQSMIVRAFAMGRYVPEDAIISRIIDNEEFAFIRFDSLKNLLIHYNTLLDYGEFINHRYEEIREDDLWDLAHDSFGGLEFAKKFPKSQTNQVFDELRNSNSLNELNVVLLSRRFESILSRQMLNGVWLQGRNQDIKRHILKVMDFIERHYKMG